MDDTGPFNPLGQTLFWTIHALEVGGTWRQRLDEHWAYFKKFGYDYTRILCDVDWSSNAGYQIDSSAANYPNLLRAALDEAWTKYGLRTELTLWGGSSRDPFALATIVRDIVMEGRQDRVLNLEMMNEANGLSDPEMVQMVAILQPTGCLAATNCAMDPNTTEADIEQDIADGATIGTVHLDRDPGQHGERWIRQPYGLRGLSCVVSHNEPIGPRSSVCETTDAGQYAMLRVEGIFFGCPVFVFHNGNCVTGLPDPAHNRIGDAWTVPGIDAMMSAVRAVDALLPMDIRHWQKTNQHGGWSTAGYANQGNKLEADAIWSDGLTADGHGCDRNYGAVNGTQVITLVSDVVHYCDLRSAQPAHVQVFDVLQPKTPITDVRLGAGGTTRLPPGNFVVHGTLG